MMRFIFFGFMVLFSFQASICRLEDGWKGIRVFQSSRQDVEKKLGKAVSETLDGAEYDDGDVFIRVEYSAEPCSKKDTFFGGFTVPKDTVLGYKVFHKKEAYLDELDWTPAEFDRGTTLHSGPRVFYGSLKHGIYFSTVPAGERGEREKLENISFEYTLSDKVKYTCK